MQKIICIACMILLVVTIAYFHARAGDLNIENVVQSSNLHDAKLVAKERFFFGGCPKNTVVRYTVVAKNINEEPVSLFVCEQLGGGAIVVSR